MNEQPQPRHKDPVSFRLSPEAIALIRELAGHHGISQASVVEMAVRQLARERNSVPSVTRRKKEE